MASAPAIHHPAGTASPRPPPGGSGGGPLDWARRNLFGSWASTAVTLAMAYLLLRGLWGFFSWAVLEATWTVPANANGQPDTRICRELKGTGACWALIGEKHRFIFFGTYPYEEHWRPLLCIFLFVALYAASCMRRFWNRSLALVWIGGLSVIAWLMWGGFLGLSYVENERWGGLVITLVLATFGIAFAFPVAIALALGRRSSLPAISTFCVSCSGKTPRRSRSSSSPPPTSRRSSGAGSRRCRGVSTRRPIPLACRGRTRRSWSSCPRPSGWSSRRWSTASSACSRTRPSS